MSKKTRLKDVTFLVFVNSKAINYETYSLSVKCLRKTFDTNIEVIDRDTFLIEPEFENKHIGNVGNGDLESSTSFFITPEIYHKVKTPILIFYSGECIVSLETVMFSIDILRNHLAECVILDHRIKKLDFFFQKLLLKTGDISFLTENQNKLLDGSQNLLLGAFFVLRNTLERFVPDIKYYIDCTNKKSTLGVFIRKGYVASILRGNVFEIQRQ